MDCRKNYWRSLAAAGLERGELSETNNHVRVGKDDHMVSGDGFLMPTEKGQKALDLRYFK